MTFRRDLKRRIRERQEQTGERYTTARAHVLGTPAPPSRPPGWPPNCVVELHDVSEQARLAGLACPVKVTPALWRSGSHIPALLEQLRRILRGPIDGAQAMQRVVLHGEPDQRSSDGPVMIMVAHIQRYFEGLQQGLRGPGLGGRVLAFESDFDGTRQTIIAKLLPRHTRDSLLVLSLFRDQSLWLSDARELWIFATGARP